MDKIETYYISDKENARVQYVPVTCKGYRESVSIEAFRRLMINTPFDMQKKYMSAKPYNFCYLVHDQYDFYQLKNRYDKLCDKFPELDRDYVIVGKPIELKEFYKKIGYDYKTKKLNGKTLSRHIDDKMKIVKVKTV